MSDQSNADSNKINLSENHSITEVFRKLKNSIFDVLFVLLDNSEEDQSMIGLCFETGVDYLQMMAFPFEDDVIEAWSSGETMDSIRQIVNKISVSAYIPGIEFDTFLILLYTLIFLIITVILDIIYVAYSFSKKKFKFTWPLVYLAKIVPLIVTVMFLPIMETLLEVVNCSAAENQNFQVLITFPDIKCWEGWHLVHSGITLLFSSIFVFVSCIVTLTVFEPRMTTNRLTARQNSSGQVIFIINKIICQFVFSFSPFSSRLPYALLLFLLSGWLYSAYNIKQPYYSKKANKFFRILSTYYFWTNFMLLVSELLKPLNFKHGLVIWICGIIFLGISIVFERKSNIDTLFSSSLKFKSGEQLESHLQYVLELHHNRNMDNNSYMLLLGYIQKHIEICLEEDCPLRVKKKKDQNEFVSGKEEEEFSCKMLLKQIERMFKFGVKKYPHCTKLRLTFAFFYMEKLDNKSKAFEQFTKAIMTNPSFGQQFIIYRFRKIITEKLQENQQGNETDLIDLIRFDNYISLCEEGMVISGKLHKEFWIELMEESPNLIRLNIVGGKITETSNIIEKNYEEVFKITIDHSILCELQYNYALYLLFVVQNIKLGKKLLKSAQANFSMKQEKLFDYESVAGEKSKMQRSKGPNTFNDQSYDEIQSLVNLSEKPILVVQSTEQSNFNAKMIKYNKKFEEIIKYESKNLINTKLKKILPQILAAKHDTFIKNWIYCQHESETLNRSQRKKNTSHNRQYINIQNTGFIRDASGLLRRVAYKVKFIPLQKYFITSFELLENPNRSAYLICNEQGVIIDRNYEALYQLPLSIQKCHLSEIVSQKNTEAMKRGTNGKNGFNLNIERNDKVKNYFCESELILYTMEMKKQNFKMEGEQFSGNLYFQNLDYNTKFKLIGVTFKISPNIYEYSANNSGAKKKNDKGIDKLQKVSSFIKSIYEHTHNHNIGSILSHRNSRMNFQNNNYEISSINFAQYTDNNGKTQEIKVYRYFDNKFRRIYYDDLFEDQSDYDFEEKNTDIEAKLSREKIADERYQERIYKAINTYIYHPEVVHLFYFGILTFMIILTLNVVSTNFFDQKVIDKSHQKASDINKTIQTTSLMSQRLIEVLYHDPFDDPAQLQSALNLANQSLEYKYSIDDITILNFQLEDGTLVNRTIQGSLMRIQGNILRYLQKLKNDENVQDHILEDIMETSFKNYLIKIKRQMEENYKTNVQLNISYVFQICLILGLLSNIVFVVGWMYNSVKIKGKVFGILIWFLDIPTKYLDFSYQKCLYFNKNYIESKKIIEKRIQINQCNHYIEEYSIKLSDDQDDDDHDKDGQNKLRQILISRYRKKGLLDKFQKSQFHKLWLFIFLNIYLFVLIALQDHVFDETQLIIKTQNYYGQQLLWQHNLLIVNKLILMKEKNNEDWPTIDLLDLQSLQTEMKKHFSEITDIQEAPIYLQIANQLMERNDALIELYQKLEYESLCQDEECELLLNNILVGGYSLYKRYISNFDVNEATWSGLQELKKVDKQYVSKSVLSTMSKWIQISIQNSNNLNTLLNIVLYSYLVCMAIAFLLVWNLYLAALNMQLNQTIKILNMIPMNMYPVGRAQVRQFLKWIIKKAGEQGQEQELDEQNQSNVYLRDEQ